MADHAARQVPSGNGEDTAQDDVRALNELRELLFHSERRELVALRERLQNPNLRAQDVSEILAEAIRLRREHGGGEALSEALGPSVEEALRESVRKDPGVLADALFPSMGPAIRKAIGEYIRSMMESFDEAMEHSLSLQGLKWRIEAFRTGKKFSDIVLLHSLVFRVEQLFLIHKKSGLLLLHAVAPSVAIQDPDMVSGMLSAIQDFVRDSFNAPAGQSLESMQVGELQVCVEQGPYASLAAVIRGQAPQDVRLRLQEKLEEAHRLFARQLEQFQGDAAPFQALCQSLSECFAARYKAKRKKPKPYFRIATAGLFIVLAVYGSFEWFENRKWERFVGELRAQPGITVTSFVKSRGRFHIRGLRDPLAADPEAILLQDQLDRKLAEFDWKPYEALDDALIVKRASALLSPPPTAMLSIQNGVLFARGEAPRGWPEFFRERAPLVAGVKSVDTFGLMDADHAEFARRKTSLEAATILFPVGVAEVPAEQQPALEKAVQDIHELTARASVLGESFTIEVVGHTDSTGPDSHNVLLSERRASQTRLELARRGIGYNLLRGRGAGYKEPLRNENTDEERKFNRSVTFHVVPGRVVPDRVIPEKAAGKQ